MLLDEHPPSNVVFFCGLVKSYDCHNSPNIEVILEQFLLSLISTSHVVASTLVGDQLPVGLHHHRVEVLHAIRHVRGHGVT